MVRTFKKSKFLYGLIGLLWLFGVIGFYYVGHKPLTPSAAINLFKAFWEFVSAFGIVIAGGGVGARLLPRTERPRIVSAVLQAAFGLGVLSIVVLVFTWTVGLHPILMMMALILLLAIFRGGVKNWLVSWKGIPAFWINGSRLGRLLAAGICLVLLLTLIDALAPALKFDALVYHLALPQTYLDRGRFVYVPENMFWGMPQTAEMLYAWAMSIAGSQGATVLGWMLGVLTLAGLLSFSGHYFGTKNGWVAVASLLAGFTLSASLAWGYADWLVMLYGWAFLVALAAWFESQDQKHLLLAGAFAGLAIGTKYTGGIIFLTGIVVLIVLRNQHQRLWSILARFVFSGVVFTLPWLIKNFLTTDNPVYPFFFPAGAMDAVRISLYQNQPSLGNWLNVAFLPVRASILGHEGSPGFGASIGPLLLGLAASAWIDLQNQPDYRRMVTKIAGIATLSGLIIWAMASRFSMLLIQSRLYFGMFPAVAILCAAGFRTISSQKFKTVRLGRIASAMVLLVTGLNLLESGTSTLAYGAPQKLLGVMSRDEFLTANLGWYFAAMQSIQELPDESRVLMLWEPRSLYCLPKCYPDEVIDRWAHDHAVLKESEEIIQAWKLQGYTHLLYHKTGADFVRSTDLRYHAEVWQVLEEVLSDLHQVSDFGGAYYLYLLNS